MQSISITEAETDLDNCGFRWPTLGISLMSGLPVLSANSCRPVEGETGPWRRFLATLLRKLRSILCSRELFRHFPTRYQTAAARPAAHSTRESPVFPKGMEMFLKQQIRQDDPRMARVYSHFEANLADLVRRGEASGARVLLCSLVSNLNEPQWFSVPPPVYRPPPSLAGAWLPLKVLLVTVTVALSLSRPPPF